MDNKEENQLIETPPSIIKEVDKVNLEEADYDQLVQMGIDVSESKTYAQWVLGKLGDAVSQKFTGSLGKYSKDIRQNPNSMQQYVNIYRKFINEDPDFTPEKYVGSIPWGVLAIAAQTSDEPQKRITELQEAGTDVSMESAFRHIKKTETGKDIPSKPKISLHWDTEKEKYRIFIKQNDLPLIDWTDVKDQLKEFLESLD